MISSANLAKVVSTTLLLLAAGCNRAANTNVNFIRSRETDQIIGGQKADSTSSIARALTAAVALIMIDEGRLKKFCSGTLISDNLVITAGHCALAAEPGLLFVTVGFRVPDLGGFDDPEGLIPVEKVIAHPQFRPENPDLDDIALMKLGEFVAASRATPVRIDTTTELSAGDKLIVAGFGISSENPLIFSDDLNFAAISVDSSLPRRFTADQTNGSGACSGDSGGPVFARKQTEIALVGEVRGRSLNASDCRHTAEFTPLSAYRDFIERAVVDLGANPVEFENGEERALGALEKYGSPRESRLEP